MTSLPKHYVMTVQTIFAVFSLYVEMLRCSSRPIILMTSMRLFSNIISCMNERLVVWLKSSVIGVHIHVVREVTLTRV